MYMYVYDIVLKCMDSIHAKFTIRTYTLGNEYLMYTLVEKAHKLNINFLVTLSTHFTYAY